ncbi:sensory box protein [Methylophaga lonarensis MPL]|uniref:Sensory box protein n=1 Tax=Methylophaga lonarensis MPL TaxID=1286106 RepID=M7PRW8_9GAMM|nr:bifunctional diguanylate cyclase/phosphodiesterase [Methylophaga lonarensis]EMR13179.1 sensory box protein [Methylophaga lonarensis MPL]
MFTTLKRLLEDKYTKISATAFAGALRIALLYGVFASLWIIYSDRLLVMIAGDDIARLAMMQTWKGLFFVSITMLLVFCLVKQLLNAKNRLITQIRDKQQRVDLILNAAPSGIQECSVTGVIGYANETHHQLLGYPPGSLVGREVWDFIADQDGLHALRAKFKLAIAEQPIPRPFEVDIRNQQGERLTVGLTWDYTRDQQGAVSGFICVVSDVTERKHQEEKILELALYDSLTKLPNRFLSLDRINQLVLETGRREQVIAVLFLDLDNFKKVNDSFGHEAGDKLLVEVANRLQQCLREADTVGRLGGDEFIILLSGLRQYTDVTHIVETVLNAIREPFVVEGCELQLSASIGIALYPDDADSASELLRNADMAMFHAKQAGKNNFVYFTAEMNDQAARRMLIEQHLQNALEKNELHLQFQPQVDLTNNRMIGAEALLRWQSRSLGSVLPDEFIQVAEQTGLIIEIGRFVIDNALMHAAKFQQIKPEFRLALNLSPSQFRDRGLTGFIKSCIERYQLAPGTLEFELTEGVLLTASTEVIGLLKELSQIGVRIAMDDFGTGYSSLSYLRRYPFSVLKIDRSFIADMTWDKADLELVNAIVAMAHSLGLQVIAEGVESRSQLRQLRQIGCDAAQGYLFSKAVDAEKLSKLMVQAEMMLTEV